jgi:hypothetical protein
LFSHKNQFIRESAVMVCSHYVSLPDDKNITLNLIYSWLHGILQWCDYDEDASLRLTAATCISNSGDHMLRDRRLSNVHREALFSAVLLLLQDDDEDVRDVMASFVSKRIFDLKDVVSSSMALRMVMNKQFMVYFEDVLAASQYLLQLMKVWALLLFAIINVIIFSFGMGSMFLLHSYKS